MNSPYQYDENFRVWIKKDYKSRIVYSDGDEVEQRIFKAVQKCKDVSCLSEELEAEITDWASLCFFSKKRANLLRPFQALFSGKRILEVGCGAGPICRFLGESGATVYGLEPSIQRARIAAERCRDLPNVTIVCDDLASFDMDEELDGIVMVGVLEYATKYSDKEDAALNFVNNLKKFIKKDTGFIITAIENQLGLKYFSGFAEDHAGVFMHGINNNYGPGEAHTYGKKCLLDIFRAAGFPYNDFYLPFPDYKLPSLVFHPGFSEKIKDTDFNLDSILSNIAYTDPQHKLALFSLDKALPLLAKNELLTELSNSFCVLSRFTPPATAGNESLFTLYNTARKKEYCKALTFTKEGPSVKITRQYLAGKNAQGTGKPIISFPQEETAYPGTIYYYELVKIVNQPGWHADHLAAWLKTWLGFIKEELITQEQYREDDFNNLYLKIKARYIDAVPINMMVHNGRHRFIDLEVDLTEDIEIGYLIFRAVFSSVSRLSSLAAPNDLRFTEIDILLQYLFQSAGFTLDQQQLDRYYEQEALLVAAVAPYSLKSVKGSITRLGIRPPLQNLLLNPAELFGLQQKNEELKNHIQIQEQQCAALNAKMLEQASLIEQLTAAVHGRQK